ncbi:MAG: SpoIIE family protein phosphatase [Spirochaetes bacterium]|nr:SpoIIE family protein phosphatase [Spirochaetota bacterium]
MNNLFGINQNNQDYILDVGFHQLAKYGQNAYGDVFISKKIAAENRLISVLSDGLGSGIKANVLATLTSTMAVEFLQKDIDLLEAVSIIMKTLPICKERKISYSTFTMIDIHDDLSTHIIEFDNPGYQVLAHSKIKNNQKKVIKINKKNNRMNNIQCSQFQSYPGDRIIFYSDGVTQSGIGTKNYPLGWGEKGVQKFAQEQIALQPDISSKDLARKIVLKSSFNDQQYPKDDISCCVISIRKPHSLLIITGPPIDRKNDSYIAGIIKKYHGKKVICGGTTANIIARETETKITTLLDEVNPHHPPYAIMPGIDLITEGVITFTKVEKLLRQADFRDNKLDNGPMKLIDLLLNSDTIDFVVGTKINEAHHDMYMPVELEVRRNIVKKVSLLLEEKYFKKTSTMYI